MTLRVMYCAIKQLKAFRLNLMQLSILEMVKEGKEEVLERGPQDNSDSGCRNSEGYKACALVGSIGSNPSTRPLNGSAVPFAEKLAAMVV